MLTASRPSMTRSLVLLILALVGLATACGGENPTSPVASDQEALIAEGDVAENDTETVADEDERASETDQAPPDAKSPTSGPADIDAMRLDNASGKVSNISILPDGRAAASVGPRLFVWDVDRPELSAIIVEQDRLLGGNVVGLEVLADGQLAIASDRIDLWSPDTNSIEVGANLTHKSRITSVVGLADGRIVSTGGGFGVTNGIQIWDPAQPLQEPLIYAAHETEVRDLALLEDRRVASLSNDGLHLWSADNTEQAPTILEQINGYILKILPGDIAAIASTNTPVALWDLNSPGNPIGEFDGHGSTVRSIELLPDGRVVSGSNDGTLQIWDPGRPGAAIQEVRGAGNIWAVAVLPDGRVLAGGDQSTIYIWDPATSAGATDRLLFPRPPDGQFLADVATVPTEAASDLGGAEPVVFEGHGEDIRAVLPLPDGRVVSVDRGSRALIWNPDDVRAAPTRYETDIGNVQASAVLPDGQIAWAADGRVEVWDPADPTADSVLYRDNRSYGTEDLAVLPGGKLALLGNGTIRIWDPTFPENEIVKLSAADVGGVGFDPRSLTASLDGSYLYAPAAADGLVIWSVASANPEPVVLALEGFAASGKPRALLDGRLAVSGTDSGGRPEVRVLDPQDPNGPPVRFRQMTSSIRAMVGHSDGRLIIGDSTGTVAIWNPSDPEAVSFGPEGICGQWVTDLDLLADGRIAVAQLGSVFIWSLDADTQPGPSCS